MFSIICDQILENRPNYHKRDFEKYRFEVLKPHHGSLVLDYSHASFTI